MNPNVTIVKHAEEVIRSFGPRSSTICDEVDSYLAGNLASLSPDATKFLQMLVELCDTCKETVTAHTEHVLVEFDHAQPKTESTAEQRPMSNGIQRFFHWVAKHPEIIVGAVTFSIGLAFFLVIRRDK